MSLIAAQSESSTEHDRALRAIEGRLLWLAAAIVD